MVSKVTSPQAQTCEHDGVAKTVTTKLCIECFHKYFGANELPRTYTWARECRNCRKPTPNLGLLIKCDVVASMAG